MTLNRFIMSEERRFPTATGEFSDLLTSIALASKLVAREVNRAGLVEDILGATGRVNVHGETVQKLDRYAHTMFVRILQDSGHLSIMASEEHEEPIEVPAGLRRGKYVLNFDPLDGSSNIDVGVSIGTIFSILHRRSTSRAPNVADCVQAGHAQVCAGYVVYGASTVLVFTTGRGVHSFTLDPELGEFVLTQPDLKTPPRGQYYSVNEGNAAGWPEPIQRFVEHLKTGGGERSPYSLRYVGSLVADFHRNLLKGGVFLYPADRRHPNGKLRLLYEANPLAMIVEEAGGSATDGRRRILDIEPESLHQRTPLIIGNAEDVQLAQSYFAEHGA
jgi:fructose-1,6-bisphosphatase I